ncbi:5'-nucleotidase C-terminal domain-containing protein [Microbacterium sp. SS28]|uniref:5'-nucleotidase C-terminal domain-containing protein n=1 Tax=Microbacterium sp. SS28 TaxID=2919948 RepID=UPI001FAA2377|nr:5'-nucleotidase C-terminal domain-containing protein [Microbacterium sp. SS28]
MRSRSIPSRSTRRRSAVALVAAALVAGALVATQPASAEELGVSPCGVPDTVPEPVAPPGPDAEARTRAEAGIAAVQTSGRITADLNRGREPGGGISQGAESTLSNFIADVQLWDVQRSRPQAQIALVYAAAVQADLTYASSGLEEPDGNVTPDEVLAVHRDVLSLCTLQLTGAELRTVLEQQWTPGDVRLPLGKLATSKDLTYVTDYTAPIGSRVSHVFFQGQPVAADALFTIALDSQLASGAYGFPGLRDATGRGNVGTTNLNALFQWFDAFEVASPDYAQRSIGVTVVPRGPGGLLPGAPLRVDVSSFEFTTNEARAIEARVGFGPTYSSQWSNPVDASLVRGTDETGRASVFPTIPSDASGTTQMRIDSIYTGTSFTIPIEVEDATFEPAPSTTYGTPSKILAKVGTPITLTVQVASPGPTNVIGEVSIYDGGKARAIASSALPADGSGRVVVTLPALSKGVHLIWVKYFGSQLQEPSQSKRVPVVIY